MGNQRSLAEIEAEIAEARAKLVADVENLVDQVHPKAIAQRSVQEAKSYVDEKVAPLKREVIAPDGSWRTDRVAMIAGAFAGLIILISIIRKIIKH